MKRISTSVPYRHMISLCTFFIATVSFNKVMSQQCRFFQPVLTQNFGIGSRPAASPLTAAQVPFLDYVGTGNMDPEKIYTVTPTSNLHSNPNVWHTTLDHTLPAGAAAGRMMLVNDREPTGVVYQDVVPQALIGDGQLCNVSFWVMNILRPNVCTDPGNNPNIFINILVQYEKPSGTWVDLASSTITEYGSTAAPLWVNQNVSFVTPTSASGSYLNLRFQINNNSVVLCGNDFVLDDIVLSRCADNIPLPLDLVNFEGNRNTNGIALNWNTANEDNVAGFEVQRSADGRNFQGIRSVNSTGSGANAYNLLDAQPVSGRNYYRLKMIDNDNKFKYSNIISLNWNVKDSKVLIFPNPASDQVNIEIPQEWRSGAVVALFNSNGQQIVNKKYPSSSVITLPLTSVNSGIYMLKVMQVNGDEVIMQKISISK